MKKTKENEFSSLFTRFTVAAIVLLLFVAAAAACITVTGRVDRNLYSVSEKDAYNEQHEQKDSFYMNNM